MHAFFKSKIFSSSEGNLRCQKTLYNRVVGKVQKHYNVVGSTAFLEGPAEEFGYVVFNAHCCKNNSEFLIGVCAKGSLLNDLCSQLVMRKTVSGKDRQLLAADQGGQSVDGGDAGVDIVSRIFTGYRVQRKSVDIQADFRCDLAKSVNGLADTVKGTSQDLRGKPDLHRMSGKTCVCIAEGHIISSLKNLDNSLVFIDFHDTADLLCAVFHVEFHDLLVRCVFDTLKDNKRAVYFTQAKIFDCHKLIPPLTVSFQYVVVEAVDIFMILIKTFQFFVWNFVFDGDDTFKDLILFQYGNRHATVYKGTALFVEIEDGFHHQELLFHRNTGVFLVKSVLLQEAQTDNPGDLQRQLLVIRKNIASDQLDDLHKRAFLVEDSHDLVSVINEFRGNMLSVPGSQVLQIFAVAGQPLDRREVTGIGEGSYPVPRSSGRNAWCSV